MATLTLRDETSGQGATGMLVAEFEATRITVEQIIRKRVALALEEPGSTTCWIPDKAGLLDKPEDLALKAFLERQFVMFVDNRQVQNLHEVVEIGPETCVSFVRLIPLTGG